MKRFLYAIMAASLAMTVGCGPKKEVAPAKAETSIDENDLDLYGEDDEATEELLRTLSALEETEDEDEEDYEDEDDSEITPEQLAEEQRRGMEALAKLIAEEQAANANVAGAEMGPDVLSTFASMSPEEQKQLIAWREKAEEWARTELETAFKEGQELGLNEPLRFAKGSAELLPGSQGALDKTIEVARDVLANGRALVVAGYAEEDLTPEEQIKLADERAEVIKKALVAAGLSGDDIHTTAHGNSLLDLLDTKETSCANVIIC